MNQIEIAKLIISQNGNCDGVNCEDCQAYIYIDKGLYSCNYLFGGTDDEKCKNWFENWLKEQYGAMNDKIQMTEKNIWYCYSCNDKKPCIFILPDEVDEKPNGCLLTISGSIWSRGKSELHQKVEEAENDYDEYVENFIDIESDDRNELIEDLYKCVQLLKQSHPEFKK